MPKWVNMVLVRGEVAELKTAIRTSEIETFSTLTELGLSIEKVREALLVGEAARDACTANDTPSAPGFFSWATTVRALRDILHLDGWISNDDGNFSTVVSPDGHTAIAVATGDEGTGKPLATPKTKYPKGSATAFAVEKNKAQLELFERNQKPVEVAKTTGTQTWILMRRRDGDSLFFELSLPAAIGNDGRIEDWAIRLIFEPVKFEVVQVSTYAEQGDSIEVSVRRRSS